MSNTTHYLTLYIYVIKTHDLPDDRANYRMIAGFSDNPESESIAAGLPRDQTLVHTATLHQILYLWLTMADDKDFNYGDLSDA